MKSILFLTIIFVAGCSTAPNLLSGEPDAVLIFPVPHSERTGLTDGGVTASCWLQGDSSSNDYFMGRFAKIQFTTKNEVVTRSYKARQTSRRKKLRTRETSIQFDEIDRSHAFDRF